MGEKDTNPTGAGGGGRRAGSRRTFLRALGATSAVAGVGVAGAQETTTGTSAEGAQTTTASSSSATETIVLGARTPYWLGLAPAAIESQRNPTLRLRSGDQYRLVWVNLDGERHRFGIEDGEGSVVQRTRAASRVGARRAVAFEATESPARYRCAFHPEAMSGPVELGSGFETTGETTTGETTAARTTEGGQTTPAAGGQVVDVAVGPEGNQLRFVPAEVEISVGDTVRWTAKSAGHNVSFKPEADRRVQLPEGAEPFATYEGNRSFAILEVGETFTHTFTVPGTYVYVCVPHADQGMIGRVVVSE